MAGDIREINVLVSNRRRKEEIRIEKKEVVQEQRENETEITIVQNEVENECESETNF